MNISIFISTEWLVWKKKDPLFEHYDDIIFAETLHEFFRSFKSKAGKDYSKSSMINLRFGLNRFLRLPPNSRVINLMRNDVFQNANQVFKGKLCQIKKSGNDKSEPRSDIAQADLDKLFDEYFISGLANGNTEEEKKVIGPSKKTHFKLRSLQMAVNI